MCKFLILSLFFCFWSLPSFAHDEGGDEEQSYQLYANLIHRLANMDFVERSPEEALSPAKIAIHRRGPVVRFLFGAKYHDIELNALINMVRELSRLYLYEAHNACADCQLPDPDRFEKAIMDKVNKGWFTTTVIALGDLAFERYGAVATDLFYRKGWMFALLKVVGEIAEDVVFGGWHFVCEAITFGILFVTKPVKYIFKGLTVPSFYSSSRLWSLKKALSASFVMRRILSRIDFQIAGSFHINDEELRHFIEDHEDKKFLQRRAEGLATWARKDREVDIDIPFTDKNIYWPYGEHFNKYVLDMDRVADRLESWGETRHAPNHRLTKFIRGLDWQLTRLRNKIERKRGLSEEEKKALTSDIQVVISLKRKVFEGHRLKRTFFLFKRSGRKSLGPLAESSDLFKKTRFWFIPFETEVLHPVVELSKEDRKLMRDMQSHTATEESLWLSRHIEDDYGQEVLGGLLDSIREVYNPESPKRHRQLRAFFVNSFLTDLVPKMQKKFMVPKLKDIYLSKDTVGDAAATWSAQLSVRRRFATFGRLVDDYSYHLKFGAVARRKALKDPTLSLHMAQYFNDLMKMSDEMTQSFARVTTREEVKVFKQEFDEMLSKIKRKQPWLDKRERGFSLKKNIFGAFSCESLY